MVKLMRLPAVLARTGLSRSVLYDQIARGRFPRPVKLTHGGRTNVWIESEIEEWVNAHALVDRATW